MCRNSSGKIEKVTQEVIFTILRIFFIVFDIYGHTEHVCYLFKAFAINSELISFEWISETSVINNNALVHRTELMNKHVLSPNVYAGMQVTNLVKGRREVWGQVGYYPSCSLPMRMGRTGAVKTDCFVTLVISTKTYSGMFFILTEAAVRASSSLIGLWSSSLLRVLKSFQPKQQTQKSFTNWKPRFPSSLKKKCWSRGLPCVPR